MTRMPLPSFSVFFGTLTEKQLNVHWAAWLDVYIYDYICTMYSKSGGRTGGNDVISECWTK